MYKHSTERFQLLNKYMMSMVKNPKIGKYLNKRATSLLRARNKLTQKNTWKGVGKKSSKSYHLGYNERVIRSI